MKKYLILILLFTIVDNIYSQDQIVYKTESIRTAEKTNWHDFDTFITFTGKTIVFRKANQDTSMKVFTVIDYKKEDSESMVFRIRDGNNNIFGLSVYYMKDYDAYLFSLYYSDDIWMEYIANRIR